MQEGAAVTPDVRRARARLRRLILDERAKVIARWDELLEARDRQLACGIDPTSRHDARREACARIVQGIDLALACWRVLG